MSTDLYLCKASITSHSEQVEQAFKMNSKFLVFLAFAILVASCNAASKERSKESNKNSKESEESRERNDSEEESKEKPKYRPERTTTVSSGTPTVPQEPSTEDITTEATGTTVDITTETTEATTEEPTAETTEETSPAEQPTTAGSISEAELNALCKGQMMSLQHYPGDCSRYVVCALGRLVGEYSCELTNINNLLGICAC